jgi:hypothetical protein
VGYRTVLELVHTRETRWIRETQSNAKVEEVNSTLLWDSNSGCLAHMPRRGGGTECRKNSAQKGLPTISPISL